MSKMLSKMNLISVVQQLPKEDIETIQGYVEMIEEKNQELKEELEEINKMIEKCGFVNIEQLMLSYCGLIAQQKEFIEWLEDKIQQQETVIAENQEKSYFLIYDDAKEDLKLSSQKAYIRRIILEEILQKYKEIIGNDINVGSKRGNKDE